jgi:hypothetical protein
MLLTAQPVERAIDAPGKLEFECLVARDEEVVPQRYQPPQGGVDTAYVPEIGILFCRRDKLRDLAILGMV